MTPRPVAVITAASRGMGAACARELAERQYDLVLMSRSGAIMELARELDAKPVTGSVTEPADLERLIRRATDTFGRIDLIVNNTGHPPKGELLALTDEDWHHALDLILLNVVRTARLAVPVMQAQGGGAIVNITTLGAVEPSLVFPISSSLRAGLHAFTKLFADRYAADNIRMNNVLPGFADSYDVDDATREAIPMKRPATVAEIARAVAFLGSPEAAYITGQNLRVDGGLGRSL